MPHCKLGLTGLNYSVVRQVFSVFVTSVHMFTAAGWRDGIKKKGREAGLEKSILDP